MKFLKTMWWEAAAYPLSAFCVVALLLCLGAGSAYAVYRPVENRPPKGYTWPEITEFKTSGGKHCVIAIFPKASRVAPPTLAMDCSWDRPAIEPAGGREHNI